MLQPYKPAHFPFLTRQCKLYTMPFLGMEWENDENYTLW